MAGNEQIIRDFCAAWSRLDAAELAGYFAEDGVYHNIPTGPVKGRATIQAFIAGFLKPWTAANFEIRTLVAGPDVVIAERLDRITMGSKGVDLPCNGVFEMKDGKIQVWRDYFDLGTYMKGLR